MRNCATYVSNDLGSESESLGRGRLLNPAIQEVTDTDPAWMVGMAGLEPATF
jgi:hypothetical protein